MKLKNIFFLTVTIVHLIVADNRHLRPRYLTDEEIEQILQAQEQAAAAEAEARIAQIQNNIIRFAQASFCTQPMKDLIQPYLEDRSLWNVWIPIHNEDNVIIDVVNIIHYVTWCGNVGQLLFLCEELNRIHQLNFLNIPTQIQNIEPTTFCINGDFLNCLVVLIGYGVDAKKITIPENIVINSEKLRMCQDAIERGVIFCRKRLEKQKLKAKKSERKARNKIKKLEAQAFEALENFSYGIDSDSD
ncbi:hypothetical protein KBB68_02325 [Candidatus Babeliales bacterium]|nr:hypothetical protein [Candidatus Babeliales bacterium]